jgi:L-alanine-DL-glutamate epimerase-like enolase superfamily enzyme
VDVSAAGTPAPCPARRAFTIASSCLAALSNVTVRVELCSGAVGWGEAPVLPSVTAGD